MLCSYWIQNKGNFFACITLTTELFQPNNWELSVTLAYQKFRLLYLIIEAKKLARLILRFHGITLHDSCHSNPSIWRKYFDFNS